LRATQALSRAWLTNQSPWPPSQSMLAPLPQILDAGANMWLGADVKFATIGMASWLSRTTTAATSTAVPRQAAFLLPAWWSKILRGRALSLVLDITWLSLAVAAPVLAGRGRMSSSLAVRHMVIAAMCLALRLVSQDSRGKPSNSC
jgi:hypothetical protein